MRQLANYAVLTIGIAAFKCKNQNKATVINRISEILCVRLNSGIDGIYAIS